MRSSSILLILLFLVSTHSFTMPTPRSSTRRSRSAVRLRSKSAKSPSKTSKKSLTIRGGASASSIPQPPGLLRRTFPSFPWPIVPDLLTYLRLFSIPLVMFLFNFPFPTTWNLPFNHRHAVAFIYALASYTDYLDGYLARRWSVTSPFGAFLDPVADKLMVSTTLILLSGLYGTLISIPTSVIIAREIGVSALREWMSGKGLRDIVKVGWAGKAKVRAGGPP